MAKRQIFKLQLSENVWDKTVLVYNKNKRICNELPVTSELKKFMGQKRKIYVLGEMKNEELYIICKVSERTW